MKIVLPTKLIANINPNSSKDNYPPNKAVITLIALEKIVKKEVVAVAALGCNPNTSIMGTIVREPPNPTRPMMNPQAKPLMINLLIPSFEILVS